MPSDMKDQIRAAKIIAILRGDYHAHIIPLAEALIAGGIRILEVTMNSPHALEMIEQLSATYADQLLIGAGTVTETGQVEQIAARGGRFVIAPDTNPSVIQAALEHNLEPMPGALTPTEINMAVRAGARIVKLFPASLGGVDYFKQIRAPLDSIDIIPTGGITIDSARDYLAAGALAVGAGSAFIPKTFEPSAAEQVQQLAQAWVTRLA